MLTCRRMHRAELDHAADWAAAEGWNPGLQDAEAFWAADPQGFFIAEREGTPAAAISVVRYSPGFAFLGFYIVPPGLRGQGLGLALWQHAVAAQPAACIGLDGVPAQQANYVKSGFALAWRNIRFAADRPAAPPVPTGIALADAATLPFTTIAAYDRLCFEAPRDAFLRAWLTLPGHVALAAQRDGQLAGYAVLRPCRQGAKIGPLFADDAAVAQGLFAALLARAPAGPVFLDVPEPNAAAVAMARAAGMAPAFETARMYTAPPPPTDQARIFGITSFELG